MISMCRIVKLQTHTHNRNKRQKCFAKVVEIRYYVTMKLFPLTYLTKYINILYYLDKILCTSIVTYNLVTHCLKSCFQKQSRVELALLQYV